MAPSSGDVLVLDEVQWADDPERGSAWTRLLLAGDYRHILLLGALDAEPLVLHAFPEAEIKVFERILPLEFVGERSLARADAGHRRRRLQPQGGARPRGRDQPAASRPRLGPLRRDAAQLASRGDRPVPRAARSDVTVATDVLGHGVNLPCETLLFAETTKFDGESRRDLLPWELAQIAGRAGRFGLVERGHVGVAHRDRRGRAPIRRSSRRRCSRTSCSPRGTSATASSTRRESGRGSPISAPTIRAASTPLSPPGTGSRRASWAYESWLAVESLSPIRGRLAAIQRRLGERNRRLGARGHLEADQRARRRGQRRAARDARARASPATRRSDRCSPSCSIPRGSATATLEDAEQAGRTASILRWFALQYPGVGGVTIERAAALEETAAAAGSSPGCGSR